MPSGQYLRTNYRRTGGELDVISLGKGFTLGSDWGGAGTNIGPIVFGSWSGNFTGTEGSAVLSIEAYSALASFYGCDKIGDGSGYRIFPFIIQRKLDTIQCCSDRSMPLYFCSLTASAGASQMLIWIGASDGSVLDGTTSAAGGPSAAFVWIGLVVSAPT